MQNKILNITNGEYFNNYLISKSKEPSVPFCEAIMDGDVSIDIYSKEFINLRTKALNVTKNEYKAKMYVYNALQCNKYQTICLWFGKDTFCQVNLLTVLAYLEQIQYSGELILNYIDDETFELVESNIEVKLGNYRNIYKDIFISKILPKNLGILYKKAIDLYFDYNSKNGALAKLVKDNLGKNKDDLICILLKNSKEYGLSDIQAEKLINSIL